MILTQSPLYIISKNCNIHSLYLEDIIKIFNKGNELQMYGYQIMLWCRDLSFYMIHTCTFRLNDCENNKRITTCSKIFDLFWSLTQDITKIIKHDMFRIITNNSPLYLWGLYDQQYTEKVHYILVTTHKRNFFNNSFNNCT